MKTLVGDKSCSQFLLTEDVPSWPWEEGSKGGEQWVGHVCQAGSKSVLGSAVEANVPSFKFGRSWIQLSLIIFVLSHGYSMNA